MAETDRRIPHLLVEDLGARALSVSEDKRHHVSRVLRLRDGDEVIATDGHGSFVPARLAGDVLEVAGDVVVRPRPTPGIGVIHAIPAGRKLDEVIRVLAEIGVEWVQPVASDRAEQFAKASGIERRLQRLRAIAVSALEQSRSGWLMDVRTPVGLAEAVLHVGLGYALEPDAPLALGDADLGAAEEVVVAVGPERGWSDQDRALLAPLRPVRLGYEVLRTEHAAAAAAAGLLTRTRWRDEGATGLEASTS